ncbi:MAG: phospholipase A [Bacteriovorax sp.]
MSQLLIPLIFLLSFYSSLIYANNEKPEIISLDRTYLALGDRSTPIKLEFNFKHRFFEEGKLAFGYHQKSFWDINNRSSPVLDTNFNPHLYYDLGEYKDIYFNLGIFEHLSNGGLDDRSRGTNMSYLHALKNFSFFHVKVNIAAKVFVSYKIDNDSPDINEYMGIWSAKLRLNELFPFENHHALEYRINSGGKYGTKFNKGNNEFSFYYQPVKKSLFNIYAQLFFGRNEHLLDYKIYHRAARIGISF